MTKFITFAGKKQVGKDTSAHMVRKLLVPTRVVPQGPGCEEAIFVEGPNAHRVKIVHFADSLKKACSIIFGIDPRDMETEEGKQKLTLIKRPVPLHDSEYSDLQGYMPYYKGAFNSRDKSEFMTVREILQFVGTDLFRRQLDPDIWVNSVFNQPWREDDIVLVADARFPNEAKIAKEKGLLIKIENPRVESSSDTHASETALDDYHDYDHIIVNDGTFDELEEKLRVVLVNEGTL